MGRAGLLIPFGWFITHILQDRAACSLSLLGEHLLIHPSSSSLCNGCIWEEVLCLSSCSATPACALRGSQSRQPNESTGFCPLILAKQPTVWGQPRQSSAEQPVCTCRPGCLQPSPYGSIFSPGLILNTAVSASLCLVLQVLVCPSYPQLSLT